MDRIPSHPYLYALSPGLVAVVDVLELFGVVFLVPTLKLRRVSPPPRTDHGPPEIRCRRFGAQWCGSAPGVESGTGPPVAVY